MSNRLPLAEFESLKDNHNIRFVFMNSSSCISSFFNDDDENLEVRVDHWLSERGVFPENPSVKSQKYFDRKRARLCKNELVLESKLSNQTSSTTGSALSNHQELNNLTAISIGTNSKLAERRKSFLKGLSLDMQLDFGLSTPEVKESPRRLRRLTLNGQADFEGLDEECCQSNPQRNKHRKLKKKCENSEF